ncbi:MAG TPA: C-terminal binding protein [Candidatus Acidoferrum sp.]|nr:C-terminal binding protein [Candidatus Acidoferrum sp.]
MVKEKPILYLVRTVNLPDLERIAKERLGDVATVRAEQEKTGRELGRILSDATAIIVDSNTDLTADVIDEMRNCKIIVTATVGFNHIDLNAAGKRDIYVSNSPGYCTEEVADHTIGLLLALTRKIFVFNDITRSGKWVDWSSAEPVYRLRGRTLGIIGLGRIGTAVTLRARVFGLHVIAFDPYIPIGYDTALGIKAVNFDTLLRDSDAISIHVPLTDETRHMLSSGEFERMKTGVFIINTSRGAVIDHDALVNSLKCQKVAGAGIDVFENEPPATDDLLLKLGNVVTTPHTGFLSVESQRDRQSMALDEVRRILEIERPRSVVNMTTMTEPI